MPRLWQVARNRGYVPGSDFVRDRFDSRVLALLVALTGIVATMPYIALQMYGIEVVLAQMGIWAVASPIVCGVPRFAASHALAASPEAVWTFLAEPGNLPRWWPGIAAVEPGRQGLAPGARWRVAGPDRPSYLRRPEMNGTLLVLEAVPRERVAFQLVDERIDVELDLRAVDGGRVEASLVVEAPWLAGVRRSFPHAALARLADRIEAAAPEARGLT